MRPRRRVMCSVVLAAAAAAALPLAGAMAGGGGYDLPDLVGDAPDGAIMQPYTGVLPGGTQPVSRLLMRFNGYVHNDGAGPLDFQGDPTGGTMAQYVQPTGGGPLVQYPSQPGDTAPAFLYDTGDGHNHWHLQAADQYSLWDDARSAPVKAGSKTGFCLYDIEHVGAQGPASAVYDGPLTGNFCDRGDPAATGLHEGVSAGWRDTYDAGLAYQWVDVSDVAPGRYWLASKPDPDNVVRESDESNNGVAFSAQEVTVPGYVATATTASTLGGRVVRLPLAATTYSDPAFGVPGAMRYRITALPATGTVTVAGAPVAAGDLLPAGVSAVTYAAPADFTGAATVTFTAEDTTVPYPTDAQGDPQAGAVQATATVTVGPYQLATVGIGGAPRSIALGAVAQLRSVVTNAGPDVVWSVNGVAGGDDTVGRIDAAGRYVAPATIPPGGVVVIRATSTEDPSAWTEVRVRIGSSLPTGPAPSPDAGLQPGQLMSRPSVMIRGRTHIATVRVGVSGHVVITAQVRGRRLAGCAIRVLAGQSASCAMTPRTTSGVVVWAHLRADDGRRRVTRVALPGGFGTGPLHVRRAGTRLNVSVSAERAGTLTVEVRTGDRLRGRCRARVTVGQVLPCTVRVGPRRAAGVTVTAVMHTAAADGVRRVTVP